MIRQVGTNRPKYDTAWTFNQGFENIGGVAFPRWLNFRPEFMWLTGKRLIGLAVVLPLAFLAHRYWALGIVVGRLAGVLLSYAAHRYALPGFSKWVLIVRIMQFVLQRCSDLSLGRMLRPRSARHLQRRLRGGHAAELVAPISRAAYPTFATIAENRTPLKLNRPGFPGGSDP